MRAPGAVEGGDSRVLEEPELPGVRPKDGPTGGRRYQRFHRRPSSPPVEIYLGRQLHMGELGRPVLIKTLPAETPGYATRRRVLLDEAAALLAAEHPHVVRLVEVLEDEAGLHLIREYIEGVGLFSVLRRLYELGSAFPPTLAAYLASEILWILDHVHQASDARGEGLSIVHRGIHPSQIWLTPTGHVKLDGFGLAKMANRRQSSTQPGLLKGFTSYFAPEYIAGETLGVAIDVYAVGVMLYELLTATRAFAGPSDHEVLWRIIKEGLPIRPLQSRQVPEDLTWIVHRATRPSPEERFSDAASMARRLDRFIEFSQTFVRPWQVRDFLVERSLYSRSVMERMQDTETTNIDVNAGNFESLAEATATVDIYIDEDPTAGASGAMFLSDSDIIMLESSDPAGRKK